MQARNRSLTSSVKTPPSSGFPSASGRSSIDMQGYDQDPGGRLMTLMDGSDSAEQLARAAEAGFAERIGGESIARAQKLFDQQLWLWGQDIARLRTNGLIDFGFERHAPPVCLTSSTCYTLADARGRHVGLWGFGAFYGEPSSGGLFLKRFHFGPCVTTTGDRPPVCWGLERWPAHRVPVTSDDWFLTHRLLDGFLTWIVEYERWIEGHTPPSHRAECLRDWRKSCCDPQQIATEWESLQKMLSKGNGNDFSESVAA